MNKNKTLALLAVLVAAGAGSLYYVNNTKSGNKPGGEPVVPVRVAAVTQASVPVIFETNGFVTPVSSVEIRSQLTSTIREVLVHEGDTVKAGQPLFRLDGRAEVAALDKLKAQLAKDQALLADARRTLTRNAELKTQGFVSQGVVDGSQSNVDALLATVEADRAAIAEAQVTVDRGLIVSPQAGRVGLVNVRAGSLVQPGSTTALTTVTQISPIDVSFTVPESRLPELVAARAQGELPVIAKVGDASAEGRLNFIDSTVDPSAGGIRVKARFDNPKQLLWPGVLSTVSLTLATLRDAAVAPLPAVQVGPEGQFVFAVGEESRVHAVPVKIRYQDARQAVLDGVATGTTVVIEGGQNLRPGARIKDAGAAKKTDGAKQ